MIDFTLCLENNNALNNLTKKKGCYNRLYIKVKSKLYKLSDLTGIPRKL